MPTKNGSATKAELAAQVDEKDAQIAALQAEKEKFQEEIQARIASTIVLEDRWIKSEGLIGEAQQTISSAIAEIEGLDLALDAQSFITAIVGVDLATELEEMFDRVGFAVHTIATVLSYRGDDPEVPRGILEAAQTDLRTFYEVAIDEDGGYDAETIGTAAIESAADQVKEIILNGERYAVIDGAPAFEVELEPVSACACGGTCEGGE